MAAMSPIMQALGLLPQSPVNHAVGLLPPSPVSGEFHSPLPAPAPGIHYFGPGGGGVVPNPSQPQHGNLGAFVAANRPGDEGHLSGVIAHLMSALGVAKDPNLRESFSTALAALHKHLAGFQKERQDALQGKLSARLLAEAHQAAAPISTGHVDTGYNPAQYQLAQGNTPQAVADWEAHHPYAMAHGQYPAWVEAYLASLHPGAAPPIPNATAAASSAPAPGLTAL